MNSLEDLMMQAGLENGFLDFRHVSNDSFWLREKNMARPIGHCEMVADWGVFWMG